MSDESPFVASFTTTNRQLAFALLTAGCSLASVPAENLYTVGFLRAKGIGKGKTIDEAAQEAIERKIPGIVTYCIKRDAIFEQAIAAWDAMVSEFQCADRDGRPPHVPEIDVETTMRVMYVLSNNLEEFGKIPWLGHQFASSGNVTRREEEIAGKPAPKEVFQGSFKIWTVGASKKLRDHLAV